MTVTLRSLIVALALVASVIAAPATKADERPAVREGAGHAVPLYGDVLRPYDAPDDPFAAGHRGIDVAAPVGSPVRASADGVVTFAGSVAGNRTVTIDHGDELLTTYSFLSEIKATKNESVARGDVIGTVGQGHSAGQEPHVHLSARRDGVYFDPLGLYVGDSYADLIALTE